MKRSLTRSQAAEILRGASTLPPAARATFMSEVDGIFSGISRRDVSDDDVASAIIAVLSGINVVMCDEGA